MVKSDSRITVNKQGNQSFLITNFNQIAQTLENRDQFILKLLTWTTNHDPEKYLDSSNKYNIVNHCNQYSKIVTLLTNIINSSKDPAALGEHQKFWKLNENLERQLESMLRDLKAIDNSIDNIVNEEFDKCNEIDDIQETIRVILSKKDANHIAKAEPYYQQREKAMATLGQKKQKKEKIKENKQALIKQILSLLTQLKRHRESGLKMCQVGEKDRKNMDSEHILVERVVEDLKETLKNEEELSTLGSEINELTQFINENQKKIQKQGSELLNLLDQQKEAALQLQSIIKLKCETEYFESSLFTMFGLSSLKKKQKKQFYSELVSLIGRIQKYIKQSKEKEKQVSKIEQGIETTTKTIGIFQHIMNKIQTENLRKQQLLKDIEKIQSRHSQQDKALSLISETQNETEKLSLKRNQLNKNLQSKMNEANVAAYKSIHEQMMKVQAEIKGKGKQLQIYKQNASENARQLYEQTMELQQNYEDILSEVVPSIWLKQSDFTKEESIRDLNLYLLKTFKRLSIAD